MNLVVVGIWQIRFVLMNYEYFLSGLFAFLLAMVVLLRGRRGSRLALGRHFGWLASFGLAISVFTWGRMFELIAPDPLISRTLANIVMIALPLSGVLLARFGIGLVIDAGHLPSWILYIPLMLLVPVSLLVSYGLVILLTAYSESAVIHWSRHLLIFPGSLLATFGCIQQWRRLRINQAGGYLRVTLLVAAAAFLVFGISFGLATTPMGGAAEAPHYENSLGFTVETWRMLAMAFLTIAVIGMMRLFEFERQQEFKRLQMEYLQAQHTANQIRQKTQREAEAWLAGVVGVSRKIANIEPENEVLGTVVKTARQMLDAAVASLALCEEGPYPTLVYEVAEGNTVTAPQVPIKNKWLHEVINTGKAMRFDFVRANGIWRNQHTEHSIDQAAVVPLMLNGVVIGLLWVTRRGVTPFSDNDLIGLGHLADQAVIALEYVAMASRLQSLAVVNERARIAREMHDGLSQLLGYLGLEMQTIQALLQQNNVSSALEQVKQTRSAIKSAYADVRQNILSLRTTLSEDADLKTALSNYAHEFGVQTGIHTDFCDETVGDWDLSPLAEVQLIRITQEALTNVRKHAQAEAVKLRLTSHEGWVRLTISDNGCGLNPEEVSSSHFGLQTMRERAADVNGKLMISSRGGEGTTVDLFLPVVPVTN